jgi:hypothetical protein
MTESEIENEYTTPSVSTGGAPPPYSRSRSSILQLNNLRDPAAEEVTAKRDKRHLLEYIK